MRAITTTSTSELIQMKMRGESLEPLVKSANETNPDEFLPAMAESSKNNPNKMSKPIEPKTYLHVGDETNFDPSKFTIENRRGKPNTLYGSEFWKNGRHRFKLKGMPLDYSYWDEFTGADYPQLHKNTGFTYQYKPEAKIYEVDTDDDFIKIPAKYWVPNPTNMIYDKWRANAKNGTTWEDAVKSFYDDVRNGKIDVNTLPVELDYEAIARDKLYSVINISQNFGRRSTQERLINGKYMVPIFDASQSIVLDPNMITNVQSWARPQESIDAHKKYMVEQDADWGDEWD